MNSDSLVKNIRAIGDSGASNVQRIWGWWSNEMMTMLPPGVQQALNDNKQTLVVSVRENLANVRLYKGELTEKVASLPMGSESADEIQKIHRRMDELTPSLSATIIQLPENSALQRKLTLPLETEDRLNNVLSFEMDRLTPFTKDQVYFDFSVTNRSKAKRAVDLNLTVAKKSTVDKVLNTLDDYGVRATVVSVSDKRLDPRRNGAADAPINLLPIDRRARRLRQKRYVPYFLSILVILLATTAALLPLIHQYGVDSALDSQVALVRSAAMAAQRTREDIERVVQQGRFFSEKRAEIPTVVQMLDEVTRILPDDTVLARFEVLGTRIRIQGESASASSLISLIEGAKLFHRASFSSPVTKNPRTNRDRFALEAEVITAGDDT